MKLGRQINSIGGGTGTKQNLESKIKMLNNVGVMKKRNPLGGINNYFTASEETLEPEFLPV